MGTPQFFEIPSTGTYRTPDGRVSYFFLEGAMIPMSLAIALGIEGAAYDTIPEFTTAQQSAIIALINQHAPGGGESTSGFPIGQFFGDSDYYDSSTVYPAVYDTLTVTADDTYALPFVIFQPCEVIGIAVRVGTGAAGTVTGAIYESWPAGGEFPESPGMPAAIVHASESDTSTATQGTKTMVVADDTFLTPGLYYVAVQFSGTPTVTSIQSTSTGRFTRNATALRTGVIDPSTTYGTFPDPFDLNNGYLDAAKMPMVLMTLRTTAT